MGLPFSCPFRVYNDVDTDLQSVLVKSISLGGDQLKIAQRSINFTQGQKETRLSANAPSMSEDEDMLSFDGLVDNLSSPSANPKHNAAVKLQKVYKSFRTRRKLADCAVLVEQSWWKLLDFAQLKHSSISFFDIEHHETAISRWSRAKTRAAKVGKGLSKNGKAQKLALQHWLEAIDPRHRYGHNLHFYYVKWLHSQSREPFFYWLDIGEGKEVNLDKCPRLKLHHQCIKYLGPIERLSYEVGVENGKLFYKESGELLDTATEPHAKWIFVLSTLKTLYVGKKKKGTFQHSSFLAGGATSAAGRLVVQNGNLKAVWPHSGHYRPTPENFQDFISFLKENNVDLSDVKMDPVDEDDVCFDKERSSHHLRNNSSEDDLIQQTQLEKEESRCKMVSEEKGSVAVVPKEEASPSLPKTDELVSKMKDDDGSDDDDEDEGIPEESILKRINSHKGMKSYQLGKQLSCKWTSGAGPRISCVRDYPSGLQFRALEQVNLSPTSLVRLKCTSSLRPGFKLSPKTVFCEASSLPCRTRSSPLCEMTQVSS